MEFPLKSLGLFIGGFASASVLCIWFRVQILGWYEEKWSPEFNLGTDILVTLILVLPVAVFCFSVGAYLVNSVQDRFWRSFVGSVFLAALFFVVSEASSHVASDILSLVLVWGTLILGSGVLGAYTRFQSRVAA